VLDITQCIKNSLLRLTNSNDYHFSISLGMLAAKRDFLHLEKWISDRINASGEPFLSALLDYIEKNIVIPAQNSTQLDTLFESTHLTKASLAIIFEGLLLSGKFDQVITARMKLKAVNVYNQILTYFPDFSNITSSEIENEANKKLTEVLDEKIDPEKFVAVLYELKVSNRSKDQEVYSCIIHHLLTEFQFYRKYPDQQLVIIGQIYGNLIKKHAIDG
jgi:CCR4-NOT transcription complex subunit 1